MKKSHVGLYFYTLTSVENHKLITDEDLLLFQQTTQSLYPLQVQSHLQQVIASLCNKTCFTGMTNCVQCDGVFVVIFFKTIYNLKKNILDSVVVINKVIKESKIGISQG